MKKAVLWILILLALNAIPGCISLKSHPLGIVPSTGETGSMEYEVIGEAAGSSSMFRLFWIIPVTPDMNYDEAVTEAVRSRGGDNLIDVTSWREHNVYIVGIVDVIHIKGKVIRYLK